METTAILYFYSRDPALVHTLTAAAHGILKGLDRTADGNGMG